LVKEARAQEPIDGLEALAGEKSPLSPNEVIVFLGDSITAAGAKELGYCRVIADAIEKRQPERKVKFVFAGVSGNKVPDLQRRLDRDVLSKHPTLVFIYIGINDVWHSNQGKGTPADQFEAGLRELISRIGETKARIVLCTPTTIGEKTDGTNRLDKLLEQYSEISRKVAAETSVTLCDLRVAFLNHLKTHNRGNTDQGILTTDGVHLNQDGNQLVANFAALAMAQELSRSAASGQTSLFNGRDLTGWHVDIPSLDNSQQTNSTFVVRHGNLVSLGRPEGHLITDQVYENYRLEVEYRFAGQPGNCGVLVHSSNPRALYKMFPKSIEVQMNHEHAGDFWCICEDVAVPDMVARRGNEQDWGVTEGKLRRILNLTDGSEKPVGQWNQMVIECLGDSIKVWVNGDLVNHGTKCTATKGQIALQAEGSEVEFRKLLLTPITILTD
jgi:lysophospholipase L1-like esterase